MQISFRKCLEACNLYAENKEIHVNLCQKRQKCTKSLLRNREIHDKCCSLGNRKDDFWFFINCFNKAILRLFLDFFLIILLSSSTNFLTSSQFTHTPTCMLSSFFNLFCNSASAQMTNFLQFDTDQIFSSQMNSPSFPTPLSIDRLCLINFYNFF